MSRRFAHPAAVIACLLLAACGAGAGPVGGGPSSPTGLAPGGPETLAAEMATLEAYAPITRRRRLAAGAFPDEFGRPYAVVPGGITQLKLAPVDAEGHPVVIPVRGEDPQIVAVEPLAGPGWPYTDDPAAGGADYPAPGAVPAPRDEFVAGELVVSYFLDDAAFTLEEVRQRLAAALARAHGEHVSAAVWLLRAPSDLVARDIANWLLLEEAVDFVERNAIGRLDKR